MTPIEQARAAFKKAVAEGELNDLLAICERHDLPLCVAERLVGFGYCQGRIDSIVERQAEIATLREAVGTPANGEP